MLTLKFWFTYLVRHKYTPGVVGLIMCVAVWAVAEMVVQAVPSAYTHVTFLDVGQGDGMFIETASGRRILIDGGPDARVVKKLARRLPTFDQTLDAIILTHPDADHLRGAFAAAEHFPVKALFMTGVFHPSATYHSFLSFIQQNHIPLYEGRAGESVDFGDGVRMDFLAPKHPVVGWVVAKTNNTAIVSRLQVGGRSFLFTADIEAPIEDQLLKAGIGHVDVLKVAHHGSKTSSEPAFLKAISPGLAVIEVGARNSYGHPAPVTLAHLYLTPAFRTDKNGDVDMWTDGQRIWVQTVRANPCPSVDCPVY